jgi:hypothetical protein
VKLTDSSLSDWLAGKSVPANKPAVQFLDVHLRAKARERGLARTAEPAVCCSRSTNGQRTNAAVLRASRRTEPRS